MVQVDCGQSRSKDAFVSNDVRGIKSATHPDLDNGNVDFGFFKYQEGDRSKELEVAGTDLVLGVGGLHAVSCVDVGCI